MRGDRLGDVWKAIPKVTCVFIAPLSFFLCLFPPSLPLSQSFLCVTEPGSARFPLPPSLFCVSKWCSWALLLSCHSKRSADGAWGCKHIPLQLNLGKGEPVQILTAHPPLSELLFLPVRLSFLSYPPPRSPPAKKEQGGKLKLIWKVSLLLQQKANQPAGNAFLSL